MGQMDVRDLAPALLAIGDLCHETNALLNGDETSVAVNVKALQRGSFEVHLLLDQIENAIGLFPANLKTAKDIIWIIFGGGGLLGLVPLIKLLRGKPIRTREILVDGSTVIDLTNANVADSQITITVAEKRLYQSETARKATERIVKPLLEPGIERFQVREANAVIQEVHGNEAEFFRAPSSLLETSEDTESEWVATFQVVTASFEDRYQWRLTDGNMNFTEKIVV